MTTTKTASKATVNQRNHRPPAIMMVHKNRSSLLLTALSLSTLLILTLLHTSPTVATADDVAIAGAADGYDAELDDADLGAATDDFVGSEADVDDPKEPSSSQTSSAAAPNPKDKSYISPKLNPDGIYLFENFDDQQIFKTKWSQSTDPKYLGKWELNSGPDRPRADSQLLLPLKARHYAISSKFTEPFKFSDDKPLVVQYEVQFREGLSCGGAYLKLLRNSALDDLSKITDKTPFTIMFGPDKCGSESKLHFIVQYLNPKTQEYSEKHWKQAKFVTDLLAAFSDKGYHLFKLVLEPNNNFEIFLDSKSVGKGNLLEDLDPPVNPPKEIVDVNDVMPADWDERPKIADEKAKKPDDWDEEAPKIIADPDAVKPEDWLQDEPQYVPDPAAKKPDDWEEMDGDWEAPLIENPKCAKASGCGEWKAPQVPNPNYKGKWKAPLIDNPNYKGKWAARMIPNPDYYFDENPFSSLDAIGAVAFELWSMDDNIAFDNLIVTGNPETAQILEVLSWEEKRAEAVASSPSLVARAQHYLKVYPWLWAVLLVGVALPLFLFISYCCDTMKKRSATEESARRKKTDEPRPASGRESPEATATEDENEGLEVGNEDKEKDKDKDKDDEEVEEAEEAAEEDDEQQEGGSLKKRQSRQKKKKNQ